MLFAKDILVKNKGGEIIAQGSPEQIVKIKESYTGIYLSKYLN